MDGPALNWKFLESFAAENRLAASDLQLFDLISVTVVCTILHRAFRASHKAAGGQ